MTATLLYARNRNPRLAVAVARHLNAEVVFEFAAPFHPAYREKFRALDPSRRIPILPENGHPLWEAMRLPAICRCGQGQISGAWTPGMIRWISRGRAYFVQACDVVYFERGTKQRYGFGPIDPGVLAGGLADFHQHGRQLDAHLLGRDYLLDSGLSCADFRMARFLAFNDVAGLPIADYPQIDAWYRRIAALLAWADPFAGLDIPQLPPISSKG